MKDIRDYPWSSHAAYLGLETIPWLETETVFSRFSGRLGSARERYDEFITDGMAEGHRAEFHSGPSDVWVLGDDSFAERALASSGGVANRCGFEACVDVVCQHFQMHPSDLSDRGRKRRPSDARAVVAWLVRHHGDLTLTEVAKHFERDVATMSTSVRRLEEKIKMPDEFREQIDCIESSIIKI